MHIIFLIFIRIIKGYEIIFSLGYGVKLYLKATMKATIELMKMSNTILMLCTQLIFSFSFVISILFIHVIPIALICETNVYLSRTTL